MFVKIGYKDGKEQIYECGRVQFASSVKSADLKCSNNLLSMSTLHNGEVDLFLNPGDRVYTMNSYGQTIDSWAAKKY